ncbi:MAG: hypothetical protein AB7E05_12420 [Sphingobium sp.]
MSDESFIMAKAVLGFGDYDDGDELLHPEMNAAVSSYALTETQYFGFSVPEHDIHGLTYLWCHPNLGVITGGAAVWQGYKGVQTSAELFDMRVFMNTDPIKDGIDDYTLDNSYSVKVIEPFKSIRTSYSDPARQNAFDVTYTAIAPPSMLPNRKHFEQIMRTKGQLTLRGKNYEIDGFNIRDRSWAEARQELAMPSPPVAWLTGTFGEDLAFNCVCHEDPAKDVVWRDLYPDATSAGALKGGWLYRDGKLLRFVKVSALIERDPIFLHPRRLEVELEDETGETHVITGHVQASLSFSLWPNAVVPVGLTRWEYRGRTGYGDTQDAQWTDFTHGMFGKNAG